MRILFAIFTAIMLTSCVEKSAGTKIGNQDCYPNPGNKATYGVPQVWSC
jgi:hypothetical protein